MEVNKATGTEAVIYNAALSRLAAKFTDTQSKVLASLMVAQSKHETGDYTSAVFKSNNNAFGYKQFIGSSYQLLGGRRSPEGNNYGNYASVADSAKEVADWIGRRSGLFSNTTTPEAYAQRLKEAGYYGDTLKDYTAGMVHYFKQFAGSAGSGMSVFVIAILVFFL